ncbi:MAG: hypothetical protein K6E54_04315 [Bacteroidaceae bacterium]|nr:hypothetical protein [Bacteroidaceae bacterium]
MTKFNDINDLKNDNVFKVPEGYFDNLSQRIMQNIPQEEEKVISTKTQRISLFSNKIIWGIVGAAACAALIFLPNMFFGNKHLEGNDKLAKTETKADNNSIASEFKADSYEEQVLDYSLIDAQDIYDYLEGEDVY